MNVQAKTKAADRPAPAEAVRPAVQETDHPVMAWLQARQKVIGFTLGAIVLVGLVGWYVIESGRRKQAQAMEALDVARGAIEVGNYPEASTGLQRVIQSFAGTEAAYEATLALNQVRLLSNQAELAIEDLRAFAATNPPEPYGSAAHGHLAIALENSGKTAEATAEYIRAAELATEEFRKIDSYLNAARTYRIEGKTAEAIAVLQDVVKRFPAQSPGLAEAKVRLAELTGGTM